MDAITIQCYQGKEIHPFLDALAQLRIQIFKEYPYLYAGDFAYEENYLQSYIACPAATIVMAFAGDRVIGASTATPLQFDKSEWQKPFLANHYDIKNIFYLGESLITKAFRGKGIYQHFFKEREAAAKNYGSKIAAFAAVQRPDHHPLKPASYKPLDKVWEHFGFKKHPELQTDFSWTDVGETQPTDKPFIYWLKTL